MRNVRCSTCGAHAAGTVVHYDHIGWAMDAWPVCEEHAGQDGVDPFDGHGRFFSPLRFRTVEEWRDYWARRKMRPPTMVGGGEVK